MGKLDYLTVGKKIKKIRETYGYSYRALAKKAGVSRSVLQQYETGTAKNVDLKEIESIASALNINLIDLLEQNQKVSTDSLPSTTSKKAIKSTQRWGLRRIFEFIWGFRVFRVVSAVAIMLSLMYAAYNIFQLAPGEAHISYEISALETVNVPPQIGFAAEFDLTKPSSNGVLKPASIGEHQHGETNAVNTVVANSVSSSATTDKIHVIVDHNVELKFTSNVTFNIRGDKFTSKDYRLFMEPISTTSWYVNNISADGIFTYSPSLSIQGVDAKSDTLYISNIECLYGTTEASFTQSAFMLSTSDFISLTIDAPDALVMLFPNDLMRVYLASDNLLNPEIIDVSDDIYVESTEEDISLSVSRDVAIAMTGEEYNISALDVSAASGRTSGLLRFSAPSTEEYNIRRQDVSFSSKKIPLDKTPLDFEIQVMNGEIINAELNGTVNEASISGSSLFHSYGSWLLGGVRSPAGVGLLIGALYKIVGDFLSGLVLKKKEEK